MSNAALGVLLPPCPTHLTPPLPPKLPHSKITTPYVSSSLQVSPGVKDGRPVLGDKPVPGRWYEGMTYGKNTSLNNFFYGVLLEHKPSSYSYQSDAISANTQLSASQYEEFHDYTVEWKLDSEEGANDGRLEWYMDGEVRN